MKRRVRARVPVAHLRVGELVRTDADGNSTYLEYGTSLCGEFRVTDDRIVAAFFVETIRVGPRMFECRVSVRRTSFPTQREHRDTRVWNGVVCLSAAEVVTAPSCAHVHELAVMHTCRRVLRDRAAHAAIRLVMETSS